MYYVCVEEGFITSVLNYEPNVPNSITVTQITDEDHAAIYTAKTHYFDIADNTVKALSQETIDINVSKEEQEKTNAEKRKFLRDTDWKVLRHIRETALNQPTTLSQEEYIALEQSRADAAATIVQIQ